jgi:hypothetical protein
VQPNLKNDYNLTMKYRRANAPGSTFFFTSDENNKMKYQSLPLWLMLFILVVLQGCSLTSAEKDRLPGIEVKPDKTNTDFIIYEDPVVGSANTHKNNDIFAINVKNQVDSQIKFSQGFVKLFAKTNNGWEEIEDLMKQPEIDMRLPTTEKFPGGMLVTVIPWIPDLKEPTQVRIFFEGQNVDTKEEVGAYMDLTLLP